VNEWIALKPPTTILNNSEEMKSHLEEEIYRRWQDLWNEYNGALWMKKLIPRVPKAANEEIVPQNVYIAQAITGNNCFRAYLKKIKKSESDECECEQIEDAEHGLKYCPRWKSNRPESLDLNDQLTKQYMIETVRKLWSQEIERKKGNPSPPQ